MAHISGTDEELTEYSVQQLIDCDKDNYACGGGWMYEGFEYISENGILKKEDYKMFSHARHTCTARPNDLKNKGHMKNIGYKEHDGRTNA